MYDFKSNDFYDIWDKVRDKYNEEEYKLDQIEKESYRVIMHFDVKNKISK